VLCGFVLDLHVMALRLALAILPSRQWLARVKAAAPRFGGEVFSPMNRIPTMLIWSTEVTTAGMKTGQKTLQRCIDEAAGRILESGVVNHWREGCIFPAEMAFFLGQCAHNDVEAIVESGRQDGFSTRILGAWAQATGGHVVSIDVEGDPVRAQTCRERLRDLPIELIKANACDAVGRQTRASAPKPTAILLDGPKHSLALALAAAAAEDHVKLFAIHNQLDGHPAMEALRLFGPQFYEDVTTSEGFAALRQAETMHCRPLRPMGRSTLGVVVLDQDKRQRLHRLIGRHFGLMQPPVVRALWQARAYALAPWLYRVSFRLDALMDRISFPRAPSTGGRKD
jgi:hypothetical protein